MPKATYLGVFSTRGPLAEPAGTNMGEQRRHYWFVWQDTIAKSYLAQQLDASHQPMGEPRLLPPETFHQSFTREPRIRAVPAIQPEVADYLNKVFARPKAPEEETTLVTGARQRDRTSSPLGRDRPKKKTEDGPAEHAGGERRGGPAFVRGDFSDLGLESQAPSGGGASAGAATGPEELDRSLRADFAMNVMRFRRGNTDGAIKEFRRMAGLTNGIVAAHKHMFTDFGVDLRKSRLPELALVYFRRALDLSPDDSHALFNVGRALYELGKYKDACDYLDKALALEPDLVCARRLLEKTRMQMEAFIPQEF